MARTLTGDSRGAGTGAALAGVVILGMLAVGCGGRAAGAPREDRASVGPTPGVLVEYHRTGGLAGVDDRLVVHEDGRVARATRTDRCELRLDGAELAALRDDLDRAGFPSLRPSPRPEHLADAFTYRVTYQGVTVRAFDTAIPERLLPALDRLSNIVGRPC